MSARAAHAARRLIRWTVALLLGLAAGAVVLFIGPRQSAGACDAVGFPSSLFGYRFWESGGSDGPGCAAPMALTWILAIATLTGIAVFIGTRRSYVPERHSPHIDFEG